MDFRFSLQLFVSFAQKDARVAGADEARNRNSREMKA
jgi:hypothetical protein